MIVSICRRAAYCAALITLIAGTAQADTPAVPLENATIANEGFAGSTGSVHVNQAAGDGNAQANLAIIATGKTSAQTQNTQGTQTTVVSSGAASIRDFAFSNITGLVQLNQTAGAGNAQGNVAIVRIGVPAAVLNDDVLSSAMPSQSASNNGSTNASANDSVGTDATTFAHAKGVVQINQTAGTGNATANGFLLQTQQSVPH